MKSLYAFLAMSLIFYWFICKASGGEVRYRTETNKINLLRGYAR